MKNFKKSSVALLLIMALLVTTFTFVPASAAGQPTTYSKESNSGERDVVCTTLDGTSAKNYYTGNYTYEKLELLSSSQLKSQLKTLMTSTHSYTSSYNDCHYKANLTDCEKNNDKVVLLYTSYSATQSQWNGWNREHVWPQSLGGGNTSGGGADLHHVRPSDAGVNSSRGNKKYGYATGSVSEKYGTNPAIGVLGGTYNSTYFEPLDNVKGDVARICLYVYVRWGSAWGADSITKVFQSVDVLLEWCALDPVDTWEMGRNEVVGKIQGNRNVFIDYPELAFLLFDKEIPDDMVTPSGKAQSSGSGSVTPDTPPVETCNHTYTAACDATCNLCGETRTASAHTYTAACDASCNLCGETRTASAHTYTDACDETCNSCGETRTASHTYDGSCDADCNVCGATRTVRHLYSSYCDATCNRCGAEREANHLCTGWTVITPATETEPGVEKGTCIYCQSEVEREIPALNTPENPPVDEEPVTPPAGDENETEDDVTTPENPNEGEDEGEGDETTEPAPSLMEIIMQLIRQILEKIMAFLQSLSEGPTPPQPEEEPAV